MCSARAHAPELPRRPDVPPTLYLLAVAVAVEAATLRYVPTAALARLGTPALVAASALALSCALAALALRTRPGRSLACLVAMSAAAAFGLALASAARVDALADELSTSAASAWTFTVEGGSSAGEHGYTARCRAERDGRPAGSVWLTSAEPLDLRERLTCVGRFRPNGEDDWGRTSRAQGVSGSVRALRLLSREPSPPPLGLVAEARGRVLGSIDPSSSDARAILAGCVCGDRRAMGERGLEDAFSASGVSHLVAVSGSHLALVASIVGALLSGAGVGGWRRRVSLVVACGLFVAFSGFAASAVRSWAMVACGEAGGALGRRGHAASSACAVCLAMCLADPTLSGQPGFVLSALSVAALSLAVPYAGYALEVAAPTLPRALGPQALRRAEAARRSVRDVLASTLVAQAATAPVVARAFGDLSLVAPLANLLLAPLFVVLMAAGLAAACLAPLPALQAAPLALADVAGGLAALVVRTTARLPVASVRAEGALAALPPLMGVLLLAAIVAWPRLTRGRLAAAAGAAAALALALVVRFELLASPRVCVLDVGQGDAILVQDGASTLLVDAGADGAVVDALRREHVLSVDALVVTHLHDDHYGGVAELVGQVPCGRVYVARGAAAHEPDELREAVRALTGKDAEELSYGDVLGVGAFEVRVVSPTGEVDGLDNEDSLMCAVSYEGDRGALEALLTGDAERDRLAEALARGDVGDVDLLKVGHHGSEASLGDAEAAGLRAEAAVASAGEHNRYGHPSEACRETLERAGTRFLCTKDVGDVTVEPGRGGARVRIGRGALS